jgi:hypothetical protein
MSPIAIKLRNNICEDCSTPCFPRPNANDPCAFCHIHRWGAHDCKEGQPYDEVKLPPGSNKKSALLKRVESYKKAGFLVGIKEFLNRRSKCSVCEQKKVLDTHPGLYGCDSCFSCSGGPERMLQSQMTCPINKW